MSAPSSGDTGPQITYAECRQCGTQIAGLDGRYSCGVCGWVNHHSDGHRELPGPTDAPNTTNPLA
jgi:ribosomal protein S27AE